MKTINYFLIASLCALVVFAGCSSELEDELPNNPDLPGVHPDGWAEKGDANFHGLTLVASHFDYDECRTCHGPNLDGGTSVVTCANPACHEQVPGLHPDGWTSPQSENWHANFFLTSRNWDLAQCTSCHGTDYNGGAAEVSCNTSGCHRAADGGPEACYTCHGERDTGTIYPTWYPTHSRHIDMGQIAELNLVCGDCHNPVNSFSDPNHLGGSNPEGAEVNLTAALAFTQTNGTEGTPTFDMDAGTCANVYCHGNFTNGNNATVDWTGENQATCGTCHGDPATGNPLPKAPHPQVETCQNCHPTVVDADQNIIDKTRHVNGILNRFNQEITDW